ncbi:MAG: nucleotide exchange factor GrpE [Thermohalobaculum sp.]|nr:nucleotide exchange factor GrpE [Thermohalobaculum sp.]
MKGTDMAKTQADAAEPIPEQTAPDTAPDAATGAAPTPDEVIAALTAERDELKDRLLRALAEAENTRRRAERDRKDAEIYGGTRLARDILSVYDNLARAVAAADDTLRTEHAALFDGIALTQRDLLNAFEKHRIQLTTPARGDRFDANLHQAMFEAPVPGAAPGTIIEVMQAGFTIGDRLLRPALVGVAKAMPQPAPESATDAAPEAAPAAGTDGGTDGATA